MSSARFARTVGAAAWAAAAACCVCQGRAAATTPAGTRRGGAAYARRELPGRMCAQPPTIDGRLADAAWADAPVAEVFLERQTGSAIADQTTARMLYDGRFIYVAFDCRDSQPSAITARETVRDTLYQTGPTEDCVEVAIDPFLTHRAADTARFALNAIGTRSAQIGGGRARKVEWSGDWDGCVARTPDGWTAEMRVPWSVLNYPSARGPATMGVNFRRFQYRTQLESVWSNTGPQDFQDLEGRWTGVQVPRAAFRPKLSLLPYALPATAATGTSTHMGMDARYTATPELTVVGTLNPDFSTVEGAVEGIQFTRGERYVAEMRPFFLEGANYFTPGGPGSLGSFFYSQRIRSFDLGTKVYGKVGPRDSVGLLHAIDFGGRSDLVAAYRHTFSPTSQTGILVSQRTGAGADNLAAIVSQQERWGKLSFSSQFGLSGGRGAGGTAKLIGVNYLDKTVAYMLCGVDLGDHLRAADGYMPFVGYRGVMSQAAGGAQWHKGFLRSYTMSVLPYFFWHSDGRPLQRGVEASFGVETRSDWGFTLDVVQTKWDDQKDATLGFSVRQNVSNRFRQWGLVFQTGTMGDRPTTFIGPTTSLRVAPGLDVGYFGSLQNLDGFAQQHVATVRYELSPTRSIGGRVVVQNGRTNWYLSFRNAGARGTETYLVIGNPNAPRFESRATLKCVFAI